MIFSAFFLNFAQRMLTCIPPMMVTVFIVLQMIDVASPWSAAEAKLDENGRRGLAICVGMSSHHSRSQGKNVSEKRRSYLLVMKGELTSITESHVNGTKVVHLVSSQWMFWIISLNVVICVWLTIQFSIPRLASYRRS